MARKSPSLALRLALAYSRGEYAVAIIGLLRKRDDFLGLRGQEVKTSPFHGGNTGSIPVGVTFYRFASESTTFMGS